MPVVERWVAAKAQTVQMEIAQANQTSPQSCSIEQWSCSLTSGRSSRPLCGPEPKMYSTATCYEMARNRRTNFARSASRISKRLDPATWDLEEEAEHMLSRARWQNLCTG